MRLSYRHIADTTSRPTPALGWSMLVCAVLWIATIVYLSTQMIYTKKIPPRVG